MRSNPIENIWKQRVIIHSVVGVPDSFFSEINGQQYQQNKCDITFSPPKGDNDVEGATSSQHAKEQDGTENRTDRLRPRPALKFPKLPTQATLHSNFQM